MHKGVVQGPYKTEDIGRACRERRITSDSWVREDPGGSWQKVTDSPFSGFFVLPSTGRILFSVTMFLILVGVWSLARA